MEWTVDARKALERALEEARSGIAGSGADAEEVLGDFRRHIESELASSGTAIVAGNDVERIVSGMGMPQTPPSLPHANASQTSHHRGAKPWLSTVSLWFSAFFGVGLPAFVVVLELLTRICSSTLFDPLPTVLHALLVSIVPLANAYLCYVLYRRKLRNPRLMGSVHGFAVGIAAYYALLFLPLTPFAAIGIVYLGAGLIPLSPLISLVVGLSLRRPLARAVDETNGPRLPRLWVCLAVSFAVLIAADLPKSITLLGVRMAASKAPTTSARGVKMLRALGSRERLLRSCYTPNRPSLDLPGFLVSLLSDPVLPNERHAIYYRVTGTPFNAMQPPRLRALRSRALIAMDEWDFGQGGDEVAARLRDLSLGHSRIDTVVMPDEATAYTEWTLTFRNASRQQREARAEIALPPGGVVSRLTLWIDGEEREAAYSGRAKVKAAYKSIVRRRRDPVLVTTSGPGMRPARPGSLDGAARRLRSARYAGGCDNVAALMRAWDIAAQGGDAAILWLHATQPIDLTSCEELLQRFERRQNGPLLYDYQFGTGPNRIARSLNGLALIEQVPVLGSPAEDMRALLARWQGVEQTFAMSRATTDNAPEGAPLGTMHVVRLWANAEICRMATFPGSGDMKAAMSMASRYHLVTPVSGAVVLENAEQYEQAKLQPVSPGDTPRVVPEPGTWALLLLGGVLLAWPALNRSVRRRIHVQQ